MAPPLWQLVATEKGKKPEHVLKSKCRFRMEKSTGTGAGGSRGVKVKPPPKPCEGCSDAPPATPSPTPAPVSAKTEPNEYTVDMEDPEQLAVDRSIIMPPVVASSPVHGLALFVFVASSRNLTP